MVVKTGDDSCGDVRNYSICFYLYSQTELEIGRDEESEETKKNKWDGDRWVNAGIDKERLDRLWIRTNDKTNNCLINITIAEYYCKTVWSGTSITRNHLARKKSNRTQKETNQLIEIMKTLLQMHYNIPHFQHHTFTMKPAITKPKNDDYRSTCINNTLRRFQKSNQMAHFNDVRIRKHSWHGIIVWLSLFLMLSRLSDMR